MSWYFMKKNSWIIILSMLFLYKVKINLLYYLTYKLNLFFQKDVFIRLKRPTKFWNIKKTTKEITEKKMCLIKKWIYNFLLLLKMQFMPCYFYLMVESSWIRNGQCCKIKNIHWPFLIPVKKMNLISKQILKNSVSHIFYSKLIMGIALILKPFLSSN